ncbi:c-type cytochrome [Posidoniimonas polymericola]|uniref:c-type cytochrome n=1 Tax=Posidoniimonas polymericola TaxID=2528002 RepID=UPI0028F45FE9|nr:c-type cytochrome [Posidoniimonas polymericola]
MATGLLAVRCLAVLCLVVLCLVGSVRAEPATLAGRPLPPGPLGEAIMLGAALVRDTSTHPLTKAYVGNRLDCTSCHLQNGTHHSAAPFVGVATAYPAWAPREGRVITLEDRILNCFMRSENGVRPPLGSRASVAIAAYITWLSDGQPIKQNPEHSLGPNATEPLTIDPTAADAARGAALYADRCAHCHGDDGWGDDDSPPVWGPDSYNNGAGLGRVAKLASWLKVAMPPDDETLTAREAIDLAAFVNSHERPVFRLEDHLPPAERLGEYNSADGE